MDGFNLIKLAEYIAVLVAAMIIGNWFTGPFCEINFLSHKSQ
jgi:hypothetical protein